MDVPRQVRGVIDALSSCDCSIGSADNLNGFSIFETVAQDTKDALVAAAVADTKVDRAVGSMVGMAVADAVGHWFEFLPVVDVPFSSGHGFDLKTFIQSADPHDAFTEPHNRFRLKLGQWTDDASMGLCMADSLLLRAAYDGSDMRQRFWNWWNNGYCNAFRKDPSRDGSVGLGGNISMSIRSCKPGKVPPPRYGAKTNDAGNGSLMRLAPVPVFFHGDLEAAMEYGAESSYTTHPGPVAAEACRLVSYIIVRAIEFEGDPGADAAAFLDRVTEEYLEVIAGQDGGPLSGVYEIRQLIASKEPETSTEVCWNWKGDVLQIERAMANRGGEYNGYPVSAGYWGSYCMDGLAMALWAVRNTKSFDECIERCVNWLGDADSHGAIAGQIAGAIYGYQRLHPKFVEHLRRWDDGEVALRGVLLFYHRDHVAAVCEEGSPTEDAGAGSEGVPRCGKRGRADP